METSTNQTVKPSLHPMVWVATISVTAASLVGIASMTGLISPHAAEAPSAKVAMAPATEAPKVEVPAVVETKPAPVVEKKAVAVQHRESRNQNEPVRVAQYGGGYGGIPVNHGTRADGGSPGGNYEVQPQSPPARVYSSSPRCNDCGTVESVRTVTKEGSGSGVGAVAGGVVGGALGNGVGQGNGRTLATIAGAVGGAMLGNKIEKDQKKVTVYESTIRMEDGSRRTVTTESRPAWQQGDAVQVDHGNVSLR